MGGVGCQGQPFIHTCQPSSLGWSGVLVSMWSDLAPSTGHKSQCSPLGLLCGTQASGGLAG